MTAPPTRKVLVLGWDDRSFLATVRSLGRRGLAVHVAACPPEATARRSRYVAAAHTLPPGEAWLDGLVALCRRERFDLVIPTNDQTLIPLHLHRVAIEPHARLAIPAADSFHLASDKLRCLELARSVGVPVPRQRVVPLPAAPDVVLDGFRLPVVLKPRSSYRADDLSRRHAVRVVTDAATLAAHMGALEPDGEVIVQEYVEGRGGGIEVLADRGELLLACHQLRVHERTSGTNTYRVTAALPAAMRAAAAALVRALAYTGVAQLEVRIDPRTAAWVLLEVNARFWGALPLTVAAGADVPYYLYLLLVEGRRDFPDRYRAGVYGRNWRLDALWVREQRRVSARQIAGELWRVLALREHGDTLVRDDPWPGIVDLGRLARRAVARLARRDSVERAEPSLARSW